MSQENVEIVKEFTRLYEAGDRNEWRDYFDPDVVWDTSASGMPSAGIYHGHEGVEQFFREWLGAWSDYEIETSEYIDAGDAVVIVFRQSGTGRASGVRAEREFFNVYDLNESKVVRCRLFESRQEALEAAGCGSRPPSTWAILRGRCRRRTPCAEFAIPSRFRVRERPSAGPSMRACSSASPFSFD